MPGEQLKVDIYILEKHERELARSMLKTVLSGLDVSGCSEPTETSYGLRVHVATDQDTELIEKLIAQKLILVEVEHTCVLASTMPTAKQARRAS